MPKYGKHDSDISFVLAVLDEGSSNIGFELPKYSYGYKEPLENLYQYYFSGNTYEMIVSRIEQLEKDVPELKRIAPKNADGLDAFIAEQSEYKERLIKA